MGALVIKMSEDNEISVNRQAYHDYFVEEKFEAGIVLSGTEIKSIRAGKISLRGSFARISKDEIWLENVHIAQYDEGSYMNQDPLRDRKLLLHRKQIDYLAGKVQTKGLTLIPLRMYLRNGKAKIEIGLCRGKKFYDKRQVIAEREAQREISRATKFRSR